MRKPNEPRNAEVRSSSRVVHLTAGRAYKWAHNNFTILQNKAEAELWARVKDTPDAKFFAPVMAADPNGEWLIQKRIRGLVGGSLSEEAHDACRRWKVYDLWSSNYIECEDGSTVIIDYGLCD